MDIPSQISDMLTSTEVTMKTPGRYAHILDGIVFLSCHWFKQLHSLIHDLERKEMEQSLSEGKSSAYIANATNLAAIIANKKEPYNDSPEHCGRWWIAVAQNFCSWISYSRKHHTYQLLAWVVSANYSSVGCRTFYAA
jgi:hypothetical protein